MSSHLLSAAIVSLPVKRVRARLPATIGAACLTVLAGCGSSQPTSAAGSASSVSGLCPRGGTVSVASDFPTTGADALGGGGTEKAAKLAVDQANASKLLGGCTVRYIAMDDASAAQGKHDPQLGAQNVTALANNLAVVGVIGPLNSSVAVAELPITNQAGLVQISPSNTDPGLTIPGSDPDINTKALQPTGKITYFRAISDDVVQATVISQYATRTLGLKKIYDIDDEETYGKDLSNYFDQFFKQQGGTIIKRVGLPGSTKDFHAALTEARGLGVDAVFYGGVAANGSGIIRAQMNDVGLSTTPLVSGDGTVDPQYFKDAGVAGGSPAFASSAPDATTLSSAQSFNRVFTATYGQDPVAYSAYAYDCMNILLNAIKQVLVDNGGEVPTDPATFRSRVIAKVAATDWHGAIGETTFDSRGDTLNHAFTIYRAMGGKWVGTETITPTG